MEQEYDELLKIYGLLLARLLNEFMQLSRPDDWDGPPLVRATGADGEAILEDWTIQATTVK